MRKEERNRQTRAFQNERVGLSHAVDYEKDFEKVMHFDSHKCTDNLLGA